MIFFDSQKMNNTTISYKTVCIQSYEEKQAISLDNKCKNKYSYSNKLASKF